jgi:hypothetical protein
VSKDQFIVIGDRYEPSRASVVFSLKVTVDSVTSELSGQCVIIVHLCCIVRLCIVHSILCVLLCDVVVLLYRCSFASSSLSLSVWLCALAVGNFSVGV